MNILMPTHDKIHAAFSKGEPAIVDLFEAVGKQVQGLARLKNKMRQSKNYKPVYQKTATTVANLPQVFEDKVFFQKTLSSNGYGKKTPQKRTETK